MEKKFIYVFNVEITLQKVKSKAVFKSPTDQKIVDSVLKNNNYLSVLSVIPFASCRKAVVRRGFKKTTLLTYVAINALTFAISYLQSMNIYMLFSK